MIGARATELFRDLGDPRLEIIDQDQAGVDVRAPRLGHLELLQESPAGDAEQVGHVALVAEGDQRRVHPVLQRRAMFDQMQPPPRDLPLAPQLERGQPDRRHQIPERQLGQNAGVDFVGLARQRRQPLDLLRVGDQHLPAVRHQLVMHEPRTVHRLHDRADRLAIDRHPASQAMQAVAIRDRRETVDQLPLIGDQAHVNSLATQIQTNVQHEHSSPARGQAGSIPPTAYLDNRWSVLCLGRLGRAAVYRARLTYAVRYGGPTSSRRLRRRGARLHRIPERQPTRGRSRPRGAVNSLGAVKATA